MWRNLKSAPDDRYLMHQSSTPRHGTHGEEERARSHERHVTGAAKPPPGRGADSATRGVTEACPF